MSRVSRAVLLLGLSAGVAVAIVFAPTAAAAAAAAECPNTKCRGAVCGYGAGKQCDMSTGTCQDKNCSIT